MRSVRLFLASLAIGSLAFMGVAQAEPTSRERGEISSWFEFYKTANAFAYNRSIECGMAPDEFSDLTSLKWVLATLPGEWFNHATVSDLYIAKYRVELSRSHIGKCNEESRKQWVATARREKVAILPLVQRIKARDGAAR